MHPSKWSNTDAARRHLIRHDHPGARARMFWNSAAYGTYRKNSETAKVVLARNTGKGRVV
jgi:hypothetical protein